MRNWKPGIAVALLAAGACAGAADYPARPIRLIVPYAAGGSTDTVARVIAQRLSQTWPQQVVVDNRTGAGTIIGTEIAARATPDGHTLLMATPPFAVNPGLYAKVPYSLERDFVPVGNVAGSSNVLAVHPSVAATTTRELIALAKSNPGKLNYGSSGVGGAGHLAMALFAAMAGIDVTHVPYKGGAPAVVDLVAGRLSLMMANLTTAQPHIRAGRLRGLGVGTRARSPLFPELPTIAESGVAGYEANNWNGVVAPAGTPKAVITKLNHALVAIVRDPATAERLTSAGLEPIGDSPEEFGRYLRAEAAKWQKLVKSLGLSAN
ncbi:MAG: tripartite tricarboxylate transporter substrate binding protein [Burkholderiales bacterium]